MFKTSQPNSGQNRRDVNQTNDQANNQFKTLEEFSAWIDEQLLIVESKHDGFLTSQSVREFFNRG